MSAFWKGVSHGAASLVIMYLPLIHLSFLNVTIGSAISVLANWLLSYSIPTTTGASASQG